MSHEALNPEQFPVNKTQHPYQRIVDSLDLADHMAMSHGVDPDQQGWKRDSLEGIHRDMHS